MSLVLGCSTEDSGSQPGADGTGSSGDASAGSVDTSGSSTGPDTVASSTGVSGETDSAASSDTSTDTDTDTSGGPRCGNGVIDAEEPCDGGELGGVTCLDLGFEIGRAACTESCELDASGCDIAPATRFGDAIEWSVPNGGSDGAGYFALAEFDLDAGDQSWSTVDLTGDGRLDLVITADNGSVPDGPSWIVYPGEDGGFGDATDWSVPNGGSDGAGYFALAEFDLDAGDQSWSTVDLTGDGRLDLVITADNGSVPDGPAWIVYPGEDGGFGAATEWSVPNGGSDGAGYFALAEFDLDPGDQSWSTVDLTGDGRLDLVVTADNGSVPDGPSWIVYPGEDGGFGAPADWSVPDGGSDGAGYFALAEFDLDPGDQSWSTVDLTGDGRLDLIITADNGSVPDGPSWIVHPGAP